MGRHEIGGRHHSGSLQQWAAAVIAHLAGLPSEAELAEPEPEPAPAADEWATPGEWAPAQREGGAVMARTLPSFVNRSNARFTPADIEVRWYDSEEDGGKYVVDLGDDALLHMRPEDVPVLVDKLTAAMVARGDAVAVALADDAEMRSATAEAEARQRDAHTEASA